MTEAVAKDPTRAADLRQIASMLRAGVDKHLLGKLAAAGTGEKPAAPAAAQELKPDLVPEKAPEKAPEKEPEKALEAAVAVVVPPPEPEALRSLEEIAREGRGLLKGALEHSGIQRDSVRLVLACEAMMLEALPAHAKEVRDFLPEVRRLLEMSREPLSKSALEALQAELLSQVKVALLALEGVHRDGAARAAAAVDEAQRRISRGVDRAALHRAGFGIGVALVVGAVLGGSVMYGYGYAYGSRDAAVARAELRMMQEQTRGRSSR